MRKTWFLALALCMGSAAAQDKASAKFIDAKGSDIGTAKLTHTANGVLIELDLRGLPPGEHAFHVHESGRCEAADGFKSAGGHYDPRGREHGYLVPGGFHAGDMPNQWVAADGTLRAHVFNAGVTLSAGESSLLDKDGSSLVIHVKPDNYKTQPTGDAGDRIACAVVVGER